MRMRPSRVLAKLRNGQSVCCATANLAEPRVVEIAGLCGFDCIWLDKEHGPNDWSPASMKEMFDLGYQSINIAVDVLSLVNTFRQAAADFEELARK